MIINHNIAALNTFRQLSSNNTAQSKSLEKLSSGYRINRAGDDAAGLAISEKMRGQIRGLDQASRNAQDGISLIQTAEGALNETHSILQRMRELAVQASNDTNTTADRTSITQEITQLQSEIDRIGTTTEFNTKKLLNGGAAVSGTITGAAAAQVTLLGGTSDTQVNATISLTAWNKATSDTTSSVAMTGFATANGILSAASTITINGVNFAFTTSNTAQNVLDTINNAGIGVTATLAGSQVTLTDNNVGAKSNMTVMTATATGVFASVATVTQGADATATITEAYTYTSDGNNITIQSGAAKGAQFAVSGATGVATITINANGGINLQIGANEKQNMYVSIGDMRASALGVNSLDMSTATSAGASITTIDTATASVSTQRSKLGAYQNRLEHTINNLGTSSENLSAAESRIRDVDMAKEMMEYTKTNILSQAATAMLAQANQIPQGVLQLLK